jgi:hypothetical protein
MTANCATSVSPQRIALLAGLLTIAVTLTVACPAIGGTYTVSACRAGWTPDVRRTALASSPEAYDLCATNDGWLKATFYTSGMQRVNPGDYAAWRFDAPLDTAITGATVRWQAVNEYATVDWGAGIAVLEMSTSTTGIQRAGSFQAVDTISGADATWVRAALVCSATGPTCRTMFTDYWAYPSLFITDSTVTLLDRLSPVVQSSSGPASSDAAWTGAEPLSFSASDRGGGVYRVLVDFDGQIVKTLPAVADDRCVDRTGSRDFAYPVPCPTQTSGTVTVNAADLPSGYHTVTVYLEDVAGNRAILIPATQKLVVNDYRAVGYYAGGRFFNPRFGTPRAVNGDGAVSGAKLAASFVRVVGKARSRHRVFRAERQVRFSQRPTVRGTLTTPSGEPISNATVFIGQQPEGQEWRLDGAVRTDSAGRFAYRPPARQSNRDLRVVYFPFSDSHEYVTSRPLTLQVEAGLTLRVSRRALRNGQRLTFSGKVLGAVPAAGVAVTLQAKVGRHYRSFRQLRASSRTGGRVRTVYRFERTTSTARYRFRLKLVRQAGLPYQGGVSAPVDVLVRP